MGTDKRSQIHGLPLDGYAEYVVTTYPSIPQHIDDTRSPATPTCLVEGGVCDFTGEGDDGNGPCIGTCWYERIVVPFPQHIEDTRGVPLYQHPEITEKITVGAFATGWDKCKCGAVVHVSPDEPHEVPAHIKYDRSYNIVGCPCCCVM